MSQEAGRSSADKEVVKAGDEDPTLLAPGKTRAQKLRGVQPRSQSTAEAEGILTTKSREELTVHDIKTILREKNIPFNSKTRKSELLSILEEQKLHKILKENIPQPSEHSLPANTHASDHKNTFTIPGHDQVQKNPSKVQSTPQVVRTIGDQVPSKDRSQTSITRQETKPVHPHKGNSKRRATNESVDNAPSHKVKRRKIEQDKPDNKPYYLKDKNESVDDLKRSLKRKTTRGGNDGTPRGEARHETKRRKTSHDGVDKTPLDVDYQSNQIDPPRLHLKRRASNGIRDDAPRNAGIQRPKKRKISRDNTNGVSMKAKATGLQQQESQDDSTLQHHVSEPDSDDISETILEQERGRWDGDDDVMMSGVSPPAEHVGWADPTVHVKTAISSQLERGYNQDAPSNARENSKEPRRSEGFTGVTQSNTVVDNVEARAKKAVCGRSGSEHRVPSQNINDTNGNTKLFNKADDEEYNETVRVDVKRFYTRRNGYFRVTIRDPESLQDAEARIEGKMRIKGHTMISLDPIPRENGRPRRYYAFSNRSIPMDPQDIPNLQTGKREELKKLEKGAVPEGACYMVLASCTYKWAGFLGSFGKTKDPDKPTWFSVTECLPHFKANINAYLRQTWKLAGQAEPRVIRAEKDNENVKSFKAPRRSRRIQELQQNCLRNNSQL